MARRSLRSFGDHVGAGKLLVRGHELPGIDESRAAAEAIQVRCDNQRGEPLAEAGDDIEHSGRAVAEEADAAQRVVQLRQLLVDDSGGSVVRWVRTEARHRGTMPCRE